MTLILAFIIGLLASVAGYFLHGIVHEIQLLLTSGFNKGTYNLLFLLFPIVGIYLTMLFIKYVVRDNISHGITRVLYAISTKIPSSRPTTAGRRWWHQASPSVSVVLWEPRHLLCSRARPSGQTWGKFSAWTRKP